MSKITWKAEKRDIDNLKPHPKNPRNFTKKGLEDLDKSIEAIGMAQPININPDGTILSGHARVLKLKQKGIKEVEVYIPNRDLDEKEQEQVLVRMNANTAGEWDIDKLANEFELPDLAEWGLEIPDIELSLPQIETEGDDDIPESAPAITVKGDLYELGSHRLLCGDSTIIDDVEKLMNGVIHLPSRKEEHENSKIVITFLGKLEEAKGAKQFVEAACNVLKTQKNKFTIKTKI